MKEIPSNQTKALENLLNNCGEEGWNLINVDFGIDGLLTFWKKEIK